MKLLNQLVTLAILSTAVSVSLVGQAVPDWARNLPNLPTKPEYYQGLGILPTAGNTNEDWQRAAGRARSEILSQIRVYVSSSATSTVEEIARGDQRELKSVFQSTTDQIAEGTLEAVPIERWYDEKNKTVYAYAAIAKREVERRYAEALNSAVVSASTRYRTGHRILEQGAPYAALQEYLEAVKLILLAESFLHKTILGDIDGDSRDDAALAFLQSEVCQLLSALRLEIVSGDNQQGEKDRALVQPLVGKLEYKAPNGSWNSVRGALLKASFITPAQGSIAAEVRTDDEGAFAFPVNEIQSGEALNKVRVSLATMGIELLGKTLTDALKCWNNLSVDFTFRMKVRTNITIAMHIVERNLGKLNPKSNVQEEIQKKLIGDRYSIVEESKISDVYPPAKLNGAVEAGNFDVAVQALSPLSDFVVVGIVNTKERSNPTPGIFFSTGSVTIRVIDSKTGRIIATAALDNEKEGGNSYEVAGMKLLQRMGKQVGEEIKTSIDKTLK